jgi:transforming growth factor-beta-induced protein
MKTKNYLKVMKTKFNLISILFLLGMLIFTSCENEDETMPDMGMKNVVEVAAEAGQFNILIEAAQKAGLADILSTAQGITVFAPTDDAFAALLSDLGVSSLDDIDAATLGSILTYHVVGQVAYSNSLSSGAVPSLNTNSPDGQPLSLLVSVGEGVMINNASVTSADIMASNGVIHVIDKVLLPPSVVDIATFSGDFSSLVSAVVKANLVETLSGEGPFTVFAPTNDAFAELFAALGISSLDEVTIEDLTAILTYHVVGDNVLSSELSSGPVGSLSGETFEVNIGGDVTLNGTIKVIVTDIQGTNGVVHVINKVLLPQ